MQKLSVQVILHMTKKAGDGTMRVSRPFLCLATSNKLPLTTLFDAKGRRLLSIQYYWLGDKTYADPRFLKLRQVADKLTGKNRHGGVFIIAAPYRDHPEDALAAIRDFLASTETLSAWLERQEPRQAT